MMVFIISHYIILLYVCFIHQKRTHIHWARRNFASKNVLKYDIFRIITFFNASSEMYFRKYLFTRILKNIISACLYWVRHSSKAQAIWKKVGGKNNKKIFSITFYCFNTEALLYFFSLIYLEVYNVFICNYIFIFTDATNVKYSKNKHSAICMLYSIIITLNAIIIHNFSLINSSTRHNVG